MISPDVKSRQNASSTLVSSSSSRMNNFLENSLNNVDVYTSYSWLPVLSRTNNNLMVKPPLNSRDLDTIHLNDNIITRLSIIPGERINFHLDDLTTLNRAARTVYVSLSTCRQPKFSPSSGDLPLSLHASSPWTNALTSSLSPPPFNDESLQFRQTPLQVNPLNRTQSPVSYTSVHGFVEASFPVLKDSPLSLTVAAPPLNNGDEISGSWEFEIMASTTPTNAYLNDSTTATSLHLVDSDTSSAVLSLPNSGILPNILNTSWKDLPSNLALHLYRVDDSSAHNLHASACAVLTNSDNSASTIQTRTIPVNFADGPLYDQFYATGLNPSTQYRAALLAKSTSFTRVIAASSTFNTKSDDNCRILPHLRFCNSIAHAVPSNPRLYPDKSAQAAVYDAYTQDAFKNLTKSLQQIACNTTSTAQYSLARGCDDCARDYKAWLCSVVLVRCDDFNTKLDQDFAELVTTKPRAVTQKFFNGTGPPRLIDHGLDPSLAHRIYANSSRNIWIDKVIQPGPYRELLPCVDVCWNMVRSCPSVLRLSCPTSGPDLNWAYASSGSCNNVTRVIIANKTANLISMLAFNRNVAYAVFCIVLLFLEMLFVI